MSRRVAIISNIPPDFSTILGANYYDDWNFDNAASLSLTGSLIDSITSSGSNGAVFSASGTARPTLVSNAVNGKGAASFDGVTDKMEVSISTAMYNFLHYGQGCYIAVCKPNDTSGVKTVINTSGSTLGRGFRFIMDLAERPQANIYPNSILAQSSVSSLDLYNFSIVENDTENVTVADKLTINHNGITYSNTVNAVGVNANALANLRMGARGNDTVFFYGNIARVIIVNALPTATQLSLIQKRLEYEYGIFPI